MGRLVKLRALGTSPGRLERIAGLAEIRANHLAFRDKLDPNERLPWSEFLRTLARTHPELADELEDDTAYGEVLASITASVERIAAQGELPFPLTYNADTTLSRVAHALVRSLRPAVVVETGVGFGVLSSTVLHALESIGGGRLVSVDLPPLGDPRGDFTGCVIPEELKDRWTLVRGTTRSRLPEVMSGSGSVGLFLSDSANVYTLQRWEYRLAKRHLSAGGAAVFNNVGAHFWRSVRADAPERAYAIQQQKDPEGATGLLLA